jgi:hypothetical protein
MTINERTRRFRGLLGTGIIALAALYCISLVGCSESQVVLTLGLVVDASEAAVAALGSTIPAPVASMIQAYLTDVGTAVNKAAPILASTETPAQKAVDVANVFAGVVAPALPAGTPQAIVLAVQAVTAAVSRFLATLPPAAASANALSAGPKPNLSGRDIATLMKIQVRAKTLVEKLPPKGR